MADKITVLIVDDIAETRENIRKLLQFEADIEVVGAARTGQEGIQLALETEPDVVIMDINMPDMDGIAATEAIRAKKPHIQIVILSVQSDSNYMRRAMLAGARDFLTKPPDIDDLTSAIRRAAEMAAQERNKVASMGGGASVGSGSQGGGFTSFLDGRIVPIYSPKGGVGVTTVTTNLAVALHTPDTPVVAVDANLQYGDLSFFFNEQSRNNVVDLAPRSAELDAEVVDDVLISHEASGVRILAAPPRLEQAEGVSAIEFSDILKYLQRNYAYVLVDTSKLLNDVTLAAFDVSDIVVVLATQDIPSVKNVRLFLDLSEALGLDRQRIMMAMNRYDKRRTITPEKVGENFKQEFASVIPMDEKLVVPAMDRGVPFLLQNKTHPVGRSVVALAQKLKEKIASLDEVEAEPAS
ncbi:MAG: response regulator [Chloroflexi bacterium]|nr:MAG: response regulator [Chloroflexota bacterium]MBL1195552.1 response regulator [Chloroflexota bacterium]NOH12835.1 response regulator [Chloroflexota bacterium]